MNAPYYLLRGGNLYNSSLNGAGSGGDYWSSIPYGSSSAYSLYFYSSSPSSSGNVSCDSYYRYYGYSVRCVAAG